MHKLFFDTALLPDGWHEDVLIGIEGSRIAEVQVGAVALAGREGADRIAGAAVPGLANLHSHTFQRGFAGLTERRGTAADHFWTWREAMYRFLRLLDPDDIEAIAAQAFVEMLEGGFSACAEFHYLHHQPDGRRYQDLGELAGRIAAAAASTGIGLTLLPVFYAHGGFDDRPPTAGQTRFICDLDTFARLAERARAMVEPLPEPGFGLAPHSLRAVNGAELAALLAAHPKGPIHIHAAEQVLEVEDCFAATGARPVEWLLDRVGLDRRWCLIHATHITEAEIRGIAASGAVAGLCPITESNLGDGLFPGVDFLAAGGRFGIGTDSNVLIAAATELRTFEYSQRLRDRARNRLGAASRSTGRRLFDAALAGGAQALGRDHGALEPGRIADIVVLETQSAALYGRRDDSLLDAWIFAAAAPVVDSVIVAGRRLVTAGRHHDRDRIATRFRSVMDRLSGTA